MALTRTLPFHDSGQLDAASPASSGLLTEVCQGLSKQQKELPSRLLYDELGSALFEAITLLPEYGLTRADERLLRTHAEAVIGQLPGPLLVTELGSGTGKKTRPILEALQRRQPVRYFPIDISTSALRRCRQELEEVTAAGPQRIHIVGLETDYLNGLREVARQRHAEERLLVLFLGSTIGNFDRPAALAFLRELRGALRQGDALLLGADLEKPEALLLSAYDDALGVTAAFNLNVLGHANRVLGANFDLSAFRHQARYDRRQRRIEMHVLSLREQGVTIAKNGFSCHLRRGETIWTEASHKFNPEELNAWARHSGFLPRRQWVDQEWPFAENLWLAD